MPKQHFGPIGNQGNKCYHWVGFSACPHLFALSIRLSGPGFWPYSAVGELGTSFQVSVKWSMLQVLPPFKSFDSPVWELSCGFLRCRPAPMGGQSPVQRLWASLFATAVTASFYLSYEISQTVAVCCGFKSSFNCNINIVFPFLHFYNERFYSLTFLCRC